MDNPAPLAALCTFRAALYACFDRRADALFVFDAGYDPESLARELGEDGERAAVLVRLRRDRCFYADPEPGPRPKGGRPRRHGAKFACRDEGTWWEPTAEHGEAEG